MPPRRRNNKLKDSSSEAKVLKDLVTSEKNPVESPCLRPRLVKNTVEISSIRKRKGIVKVETSDNDDNLLIEEPLVRGEKRSTKLIKNISNKRKVCEHSEVINRNRVGKIVSKEDSKQISSENTLKELRIFVQKCEPCSPHKKVIVDESQSLPSRVRKIKEIADVKVEILESDDNSAVKETKVRGKKRLIKKNNVSNKKYFPKRSKVNEETLACKNDTKERSQQESCENTTKELWPLEKKIEPCNSPCKRIKKKEGLASSSSSESEWEEVADNIQDSLDDYKPDIPEEGVNITLGEPLLPKRRRRKFDVMEFIRMQVNRFNKSVQLSLHKVHILCLVSHGIYLNRILNSPDLKGLSFSFFPLELLNIMKKLSKVSIDLIRKVVKFFNGLFLIDNGFVPLGSDLMQNLISNFEMQKVPNASQYNMMFVVFARAFGMNVRLCYSLYPISSKPKNLLKKPKNNNKSDSFKVTENSAPQKSEEKPSVGKSCKGRKNNISIREDVTSKTSVTPHVSLEIKKGNGVKKEVNLDKNGSKSSQRGKGQQKNASARQLPKRKKKRVSYKISSGESGNDDSDNDGDFVAGEGSDSDFADPIPVYSSKRKKALERKSKNRKVLSSDDSDDEQISHVKQSNGIEYWAEVYSDVDKKWVSVECSTNVVDMPYGIEKLADQPISYVIALDNKSHLKDVTKRYCSQWLTHSRRLRVDVEWWEETIEPFLPPKDKLDIEEDEQMEEVLFNKPMPTTVSKFKSHPLYALKRHLLKYEAIFPDDAPPLGFINKDPVYARECVHTLRSRETWIKEARVVKVGEEPYKIVTTLKWDKVNRKILKDIPLGLFGYWQTDEFVPPVAKDGIVPKNEYGNVDLFKSCMLPKGTVHLQLSGLNRIARKLGIDCCAALVGFDVHKMGIHPVFDGWIVCEEFKETMELAWEEEQVNIRKREEEKREKRVYGNWKKLIRGLLIRERIKTKYAIK